jgi:hypothetical protein
MGVKGLLPRVSPGLRLFKEVALMVSKSWLSQLVLTYGIRATRKLRRTSNKNLKFLNTSLRDFIQIYLESLPHMRREVFRTLPVLFYLSGRRFAC